MFSVNRKELITVTYKIIFSAHGMFLINVDVAFCLWSKYLVTSCFQLQWWKSLFTVVWWQEKQ